MTVGFVPVIIFDKGKSLVPCVVFHALNNSLSAFEKNNEEVAAALPISAGQFEMISAGVCIVLLAVYASVLVKKWKQPQE